MTAFHPSTYSDVYVWPWPPGTPVANGRSAVTCQKVTKGSQNMPLSTSEPGGSLIQSGSLKIRCGLHQTIGSDGCIMYSTRVPSQGWPFGGMSRARVVGEPHDPSVLVDRLDLRAAGVAVVAELPEQRVEVGRPGEQRAGGEVGHAVFAAEGGLAAERPQAFPGHEQLGTLVRGQLRPGAVDRVEQRAARLAGLGLVDQVGNPRRQVGVLDRHRRRVAAGEVLERVHQRRVDPAAAGRRHHEQVLAVERRPYARGP